MSSEPWATVRTTAKVEASTGKSISRFRPTILFQKVKLLFCFLLKCRRAGKAELWSRNREAPQLKITTLPVGEGGPTRRVTGDLIGPRGLLLFCR